MSPGIVMTAAFAALTTVLVASPAFAKYGAIAYDESSGKRGFAWDYDTQKEADEKAVRDCGKECKVVVRFGAKECAAIATPEKGKGVGAASRKTAADAKLAALENCQKNVPGKCEVQDARCNR